MKHVALWAALAAVSAAGFTQPLAAQTVRGRVVEHHTGYPVGLARITVLDEAGQQVGYAQSDGAGEFTIRLQRAGRFSVHAELIGYHNATSSLSDVGEGDEVYRVLSVRRGPRTDGTDGRGYGLGPRTILGPPTPGTAATDTRPAVSRAPAERSGPGKATDAGGAGVAARPAPSAKPQRDGRGVREPRVTRPVPRAGGTVRLPARP